jgi:hypothetical protein
VIHLVHEPNLVFTSLTIELCITKGNKRQVLYFLKILISPRRPLPYSGTCSLSSKSSLALAITKKNKNEYPRRNMTRENFIIGPSGVRALPLAAGINEGGHYFW